MTKYLNNKFYSEVKNDKYIIHDYKIFRETVIPKSLKTQYETNHDTKVPKCKKVVQSEYGSLVLVLVDKKELSGELVLVDKNVNNGNQ